MKENYIESIVKHYEECLEKFGDSHLGVDWPKLEDVNKRYKVMLEIIKYHEKEVSELTLLDFGCGASHLLEYILANQMNNIVYSGLDVSEKFISLSKKKFPSTPFYCLDILNDSTGLLAFDFVVMNGVFTEKRQLTFNEMWLYVQKVITKVYHITKSGIAVNFMSKAVDWERDDLFHLSKDLLADFLTKSISRKFIIRNDYGLYEYTVYIYK